MAFKHLKRLLTTEQKDAENETILPDKEETKDELMQFSEQVTSVASEPENDLFLTGQLLVATPQISNGIFHKSVIYIFAHSAEGTMGCIINQPIEMVHFSALLEQVDIPATKAMRDIPVHFGGPTERSRGFVMHTTDSAPVHESIAEHNGIAITAVTGILRDIAEGEGPESAALIVGYAGWGPGQLEREMEENSWITVPATKELIFDTANEHVWSLASQELGIADMAFYSQQVGHA